jgi:hypothetical protein
MRCECGRECTVPTMGEIRRLPPAARPAERPAAAGQSKWGVPQRLLSAGLVVLLLSSILAAVLAYGQYSYDQYIAGRIQQQRNAVRGLKPWESILFYRKQLAPGIDTVGESFFGQQRQRLAVGLVIAIAAGAIGAVLAGAGIVGIVRKRSGSA